MGKISRKKAGTRVLKGDVTARKVQYEGKTAGGASKKHQT